METRLNETQKELLKIAKQNGSLKFSDFERLWTSPIAQKTNVRYFILNGLIEDDLEHATWKDKVFNLIEVKE